MQPITKSTRAMTGARVLTSAQWLPIIKEKELTKQQDEEKENRKHIREEKKKQREEEQKKEVKHKGQ